MTLPLIGITTYHREPAGRPRFTIPSSYVDAVRDAGGTAVLLAPGESSPAALLERLDGLVLTGGGDLDPAFGAPAHPSTYFTCPERDAFEIDLVNVALARETPTLAICRGMQILNAARGGSLHPHLADVVGEDVVHRVSQDEAAAHPVEIAADSLLAVAQRATRAEAVPSWHHQCVDALGEGLRAVAWAADGVVEAVESASSRLLAVQWHPELAPVGSPGRRVFAQLVGWAGN